MQILIAILTLMVIIIGVILNRITLYSIRKNTERARDIATIMQHTLNDNNYVTKLSLKERRADNMYGDFLPPEGMTYEESLLYVHPEDKHNYQNFMNRLVRGEKSTETCYRWDKSLSLHLGDWHYMRVVGVGEYDESDSKVPLHLYCTLYDETEQRLQQKEEMDLTDRYGKLFEQSIVGQAFYDKEGHLLTANQKLREILKFKDENDPFYHTYTLFELPTFRYLLHVDAVDDLYFCTQTVIYERDVNLVSEIRVHPIYHDNQLQMFTLYIRDITQERELHLQHKHNLQQINRTNKHIKEYETELKYLMENVDMRFFRTSFEKREVYLYKEMSQPEKTLTFDDVIARFMEGGFAQALQNPSELLKEPKSKLCHMHSLFHDNSELEWNFIDSVPYYDENGTLTGTYGVVRNVTKLMEKQELLKQETERASQSGMRKSTFLASMSHEIRTPLNAIVGFSDVLATQDTPEEREHILDVITTNCDMLLRLVNDMLALSSLENGDIYIKPARINFTKCFADVTASLARRVQNPLVEYIVDNPYPKLYTTLDGGRIQQVITNFVTNAVKYTHKGHIKIGYRKETRHNQEGLYIYCEDTGDGIPKEHQDKVFDKFVKLNDFVQGTGLGLNICKVIVDNCKGEIGVTSGGKGCGSTFWTWIPCKEENEETT